MNCDRLPSSISYTIFYKDYLVPSRPVIFTDVSTQWPAISRWIKDNNLDVSQLCRDFGSSAVNVLRKNGETGIITFSEFVQNMAHEQTYLKDFHFCLARPDLDLYKIPHMFADDWFNMEAVFSGIDDYRFMYFGTDGTFTPMHTDVGGSLSWSTNITGKKETKQQKKK